MKNKVACAAGSCSLAGISKINDGIVPALVAKLKENSLITAIDVSSNHRCAKSILTFVSITQKQCSLVPG